MRSRTLVFPARITLTALVTLATAELIPIAAGWPATPTLFRHSVVHTVGTPEMRDYAKGLVERIPLPIKGKVEGGTQIADQHASSEARDALSLKVPPFARRTVVGSVNMVRRLFGPFAWVMPQRWSADMLLTNLYLNYPGMLVWYALLPLIAVGLLTTAWKLRTFDAIDAPLVALAVSLCFYCAQYLSINLAVRQRDIVFPFLMPFAAIAYEQHQGSRAGRRIYAAYWMALVGLAVGHMAVRAFLGSS